MRCPDIFLNKRMQFSLYCCIFLGCSSCSSLDPENLFSIMDVHDNLDEWVDVGVSVLCHPLQYSVPFFQTVVWSIGVEVVPQKSVIINLLLCSIICKGQSGQLSSRARKPDVLNAAQRNKVGKQYLISAVNSKYFKPTFIRDSFISRLLKINSLAEINILN